jgi:hypothetical protein
MNQAELERAILDARDRDNTRELERLQREYRRGGYTTRISSAPIELRYGGDSRSRLTARTGGATTTRLPLAVRFDTDATWQFRQIPFASDREHGSWLFGRRAGTEILIEGLAGPDGSDTAGARDHILFNVERALELERLGSRVCGILHSHPSGYDRLSETDMQMAARWADKLREPFVDVLALPNEYSDWPWTPPLLRCWITHPDDGTTRAASLILEEGSY